MVVMVALALEMIRGQISGVSEMVRLIQTEAVAEPLHQNGLSQPVFLHSGSSPRRNQGCRFLSGRECQAVGHCETET